MGMEVLTPNYAYDKVLSVIDYCGDIRRNKASGGQSTYHRDFSPNNIKRLIVSPDGAIAEFHVKVGGRMAEAVTISPQCVNRVQLLEDYKPMTAVLYADRICASVEEVIVCTMSTTDGVSLTTKELDFQGLIERYQNVKGDLKETIKGRYKRLYSYSVFSGTINEVVELVKQDCPDGLLSKNSTFVDRSVIEYFHEDDWYKGYGSTAGVYSMDAKDGVLNSHFQRIIKERQDSEFASKVAESKSNRMSKEKTAVLNEYRKYKGLVTCLSYLTIMQSENGKSLLTNDYFHFLRSVKVANSEFVFDDMPNLGLVPVEREEPTMGYAKDLISTLQTLTAEYYTVLVRYILTEIASIKRNEPFVYKAIMYSCSSCDFVVPPSELDLATQCGFSSLGRLSIADSLSNLCVLFCSVFISSANGKSLLKYKEKSYWEEVYNDIRKDD